MVRLSTRSAITGVVILGLAIVAERVFVAAHAPLSWAAASVVVAVLIDPIVDLLDRRIPRLAAVLIALLVAAVGIWGVIYVAADDLSSGIDRLGQAAQDAAEELEARDDGVGQAARDVDATRRVDLFVEALDERVTGGEDVLASTAGTAPTYFLSGILTLFLMSYGPRLAQSAVDQLPDPRRRREVVDIVTPALQRSRRAVLLTVAEALLVGVLVGTAAALADVPAPAALGVTAGVMALLPHVGLVLGTLPLVLLVLALRSDIAAIVTVVLVLLCQLGDSYWLRRKIARRSVHVGLLVPWTVALVGYAVYGVGGAAYGVALAVFVLALLDELGKHARAGAPVDTAPGDRATPTSPLPVAGPAPTGAGG
ncbi:MAG TPA: AI-2E family transporter [Acidimicrobiales bacterium]|nr:AI-2E family transporter [Acidimicrobiales bacterium]